MIKNTNSLYRLLLIGLLCFGTQSVWGFQAYLKEEYKNKDFEIASFDNTQFENAIKDLDYSKKDKKKKKKKRESDASSSNNSSSGSNYNRPERRSIFSGSGAEFLKVFSFVILIALLAFLIYKVMGGKSFISNSKITKKQKEAFDIRELEENIHDTELGGYIQQSLNSEDYKMAIRLYYLSVIKELSTARLINWKKDKTNNEYIREMRKTSFAASFQNITRLFERVWYSDMEMTQSIFAKIEPSFKDFLANFSGRKGG